MSGLAASTASTRRSSAGSWNPCHQGPACCAVRPRLSCCHAGATSRSGLW